MWFLYHHPIPPITLLLPVLISETHQVVCLCLTFQMTCSLTCELQYLTKSQFLFKQEMKIFLLEIEAESCRKKLATALQFLVCSLTTLT